MPLGDAQRADPGVCAHGARQRCARTRRSGGAYAAPSAAGHRVAGRHLGRGVDRRLRHDRTGLRPAGAGQDDGGGDAEARLRITAVDHGCVFDFRRRHQPDYRRGVWLRRSTHQMSVLAFAPPATPRVLRVFGGNLVAILGVALGIVVIVAAAGAPLISPLNPFEQSTANRLSGPDALHLLGRDTFGRDLFTRVLYGGRVSLLVGVGSVALGGALGTLLGVIAGYSGRWVENAIMRIVDVLMAFPSLLLGLTVLAVLVA